jgi:sugar (pentulose or hexulose) kinase
MSALPVIAVFDAGKTNKKIFLFDEQYRIVWERTHHLPETIDEDGDPCEDLDLLRDWVVNGFNGLRQLRDYHLRAVNFSAYGASLVYVGEDGQPPAPLYNYLKAFPGGLQDQLYGRYGGAECFSLQTASPVLGSLNSGMQLYRLQQEQAGLFSRIRYALHLPQYLSFLLTGKAYSELMSIGCHTQFWDFSRRHYHEWVYREGMIGKLAPMASSTAVRPLRGGLVAGIGVHDSSAALIPYLQTFPEPFILISTGTWCISMNPFNSAPLTAAELRQDCLCYLSYQGRPVKASRLFAGHAHEREVRRLAEHFQVAEGYCQEIRFDPEIVSALRAEPAPEEYASVEVAYHRLMLDLVQQQVASTRLVLAGTTVRRIFVDGGFSKNELYMHLLAGAFPELHVFAASVPQATAIGAALAIHGHWNKGGRPEGHVEVKEYFQFKQ